PTASTALPYTTLFRSDRRERHLLPYRRIGDQVEGLVRIAEPDDVTVNEAQCLQQAIERPIVGVVDPFPDQAVDDARRRPRNQQRSEEHTPELQSLRHI